MNPYESPQPDKYQERSWMSQKFIDVLHILVVAAIMVPAIPFILIWCVLLVIHTVLGKDLLRTVAYTSIGYGVGFLLILSLYKWFV